MSKGIYGYWDNQKEYVVYIGQTSNLEERRKKHSYPAKNNKINDVLINNPNRYEYFILAEGDFSDKTLDEMEIYAISIFKTNKYKYPDKSVFNFTDGGGGIRGFRHSDETKTKISEAGKGRVWSDESKKKLSNSLKGHVGWNKGKSISDEHKKKISESMKGRTISDETKEKLSKLNMGKFKGDKSGKWKEYIRITKYGKRNGKQRYCLRKEGKVLKTSIDIYKLISFSFENFLNEKLHIEVNE